MAFDNVTLFEINLREFPFGGETADETEGDSVEITEEPADDESSGASGGRGRKAVALLFGAVALAVVARQVAKRRGSDDEFETEDVEPGVERVEA